MTDRNGNQKWNAARIAARIGVGERDVQKVMNRQKSIGRMTGKHREEIANLLAQGQSPEDIAFHTDLPVSQIHKHMNRGM